MLKFARSFGAAFALVLLGYAGAFATNSYYWSNNQGFPSVTGPWLGDSNYNINSLFTAAARDTGHGFAPNLSVSQTNSQAACTALPNDGFIQITTSASTGAVCLPPAIAGKRVMVANATGQTINFYGSNSPFMVGTQDTVNGVNGNISNFNNPGVALSICIAANNGAWYCKS